MYLVKDKKSPYWYAVYVLDGVRVKRSTKKTSKSEAEKILIKIRSQIQFNPHLIKISLQNFAEEYATFIEASGSITYLRSVKLSFRIIIKFLGNVVLSSIKPKNLEMFIVTTAQKSPYAARLYLKTLKASFTKAVAWNYLTDNPLKNIRPPKLEKKHPVYVTQDDFEKIQQHVKSKVLRRVYFVAFYTGLRIGELLNLRWMDIDLINRSIYLRNTSKHHTKNRKDRAVPMSNAVFELLYTMYCEEKTGSAENYVFHRVIFIRLTENHASKFFKKAVRAAGIDDRVHLHTLRHSFASMLVQKNVSLYVIKELLGHADISTTQIYAHLKKENLEQAVKLLDDNCRSP